MAEEDDVESKTEDPTDRRLEELARSGQLFISNEFSIAVSFLIGTFVIYFWLPQFFFKVADVTKYYLSVTNFSAQNINLFPVLQIFIYLVSILLVFPLLSVTLGLFQTRGNFKENILSFNLNAINPFNGIKRILSLQNLFNFGKSLGKLLILITILFFTCKNDIQQIFFSKSTSLDFLLATLAWCGFKILIKGALIILLFGILDYGLGYLIWLRNNRMTKQEVKDDRRASEGDELVKKKILAKSTSRIMQQIRKNLSTATVVVTNPTHYAVALRYVSQKDSAPVVVAKGVDFIALRIRQLAVEYGIPIVERPSLARALYRRVKIGQQIPLDFFRVVAEVIAYVYKLQNKNKRVV